jgi:hypothetical protein
MTTCRKDRFEVWRGLSTVSRFPISMASRRSAVPGLHRLQIPRPSHQGKLPHPHGLGQPSPHHPRRPVQVRAMAGNSVSGRERCPSSETLALRLPPGCHRQQALSLLLAGRLPPAGLALSMLGICKSTDQYLFLISLITVVISLITVVIKTYLI